jgi:hypothetical protein
MNSSDNENMQGGDSDMGKRQGLIAVNDLTYALEPDLSVAVNKTMKKHFFQSTEYKDNQRAICIVNSGADYIDTRRSHLTFGVRLPKSIASDAQLMKERVVRNRGGLGDGSENLLYKRDTAKPLTVAHPSKIDEIGATDDEHPGIPHAQTYVRYLWLDWCGGRGVYLDRKCVGAWSRQAGIV